jgi:hypothetical protein
MVFCVPSTARETEGWGRWNAGVVLCGQRGSSCRTKPLVAHVTQTLFFAETPIIAAICPCEAAQSKMVSDAAGFLSLKRSVCSRESVGEAQCRRMDELAGGVEWAGPTSAKLKTGEGVDHDLCHDASLSVSYSLYRTKYRGKIS